MQALEAMCLVGALSRVALSFLPSERGIVWLKTIAFSKDVIMCVATVLTLAIALARFVSNIVSLAMAFAAVIVNVWVLARTFVFCRLKGIGLRTDIRIDSLEVVLLLSGGVKDIRFGGLTKLCVARAFAGVSNISCLARTVTVY